MLELIAKRGRGADRRQTVAIQLSESDELVVAAAAGEVPPGLEGSRSPLEGTISGEVMRTHRAERVSELSVRSLGPAVDGHELRPGGALLVPLVFKGQAVGVLAAFGRAVGGPGFDVRDERLLLGFAGSAASAVVTAQSVTRDLFDRSVASAEEERRRWARELHDETLQDLAGLQLLLSSARRSDDPAQVERSVDGALEQITTSIDRLRRLIAELRPAALEELGLKAAVEGLAEEMPLGGVSCRVDLAYESGREATRLTPSVEAVAYRLTQEALANAAKAQWSRLRRGRARRGRGRSDPLHPRRR